MTCRTRMRMYREVPMLGWTAHKQKDMYGNKDKGLQIFNITHIHTNMYTKTGRRKRLQLAS